MQPMVANSFSSRLNAALTEAGIPQDRKRLATVAKMFGVSREAVRKWLSGDSIPDTKRIPEIANKLNVTVEWLLGGKSAEPEILSVRAGPGEDDIQIPHYRDVHLSAGPGHHVSYESGTYTDDSLSFKRSWLDRKGYSEKNLVVVYASGESMSPRICDGDILVVKIDENHDIRDGRVYAINYDGMIKVKRLSKRYDGSIVVSSDNPDPRYKEEIIPAHDLELLNIIGRVVWVGGDL